MSEKEKKIIETFSSVMPKLSEKDKSYLLGLGEGMAIKAADEEKKESFRQHSWRMKLEQWTLIRWKQ